MSLLIRTLFVVAVAAGFAVPAARADEPKVKKPQPGAEPGKPIIIQIDASKIPPEMLKDLLKLAKSTDATKPEPTKPGTKPETTKPGAKPEANKPGTKPEATKPMKPGTKPDTTKVGKTISLSDAIAIAEKLTKGTVVRAEREDAKDGSAQFVLDVIGKDGKSKVVLDAGGEVLKGGTPGGDDKPKSKVKIK